MSDDGSTLTELGGRGRIRRLPRSVAYVIVVTLFGAVYGAIVYLLSAQWGVQTLAGSVRIFAAAFLLSLAIGIPIHVRVQTLVDRWLSVRRRTADTLHALFARLTTGMPLGNLVGRALAIVRSDLGLTAATLFLYSPDGSELVRSASAGSVETTVRLSGEHSLFTVLQTLRTEISRTTLRQQGRYANMRTECLAAMDAMHADLLFPIEVEGRLVGVLAFSGPHALQRLTPSEVEILRALSAELSVCVARAQDEERVRAARLDLERFVRYLPRPVATEVLGSGLPGEHGRRRVVTTVSCTVHGFDRFAAIADPDEVADILTRYHAASAAEARREGGTFAYAGGEHLVVVFGDPEPHRDHAARALRMATRLVREARTLFAPWRPHIPELDVRAGVATGPAFVGFIAVGSDIDYQVIGAPKHLADELASMGSAGEILLTAATLAVAGDGVETETTPLAARGAGGSPVHRLAAIAGAD